MSGVVGRLLRTLGQAPAAGSAPSAPTLSVANSGDGDAVVATVTGGAGVTVQLLYREVSATAWTTGSTRVGSGAITQTGLDDNTWYSFVAYATSAGYNSLPSAETRVFCTSGADDPITAFMVNAAGVLLGVNGMSAQIGTRLYQGWPAEAPDMPFVTLGMERSMDSDFPWGTWAGLLLVSMYATTADVLNGIEDLVNDYVAAYDFADACSDDDTVLAIYLAPGEPYVSPDDVVQDERDGRLLYLVRTLRFDFRLVARAENQP